MLLICRFRTYLVHAESESESEWGFIHPECLYIQGIYFGWRVQTYNIQHIGYNNTKMCPHGVPNKVIVQI